MFQQLNAPICLVEVNGKNYLIAECKAIKTTYF